MSDWKCETAFSTLNCRKKDSPMSKQTLYPQVRPATDIMDTEDGIRIRANMPGVTENDLQCSLRGNTLHITASSRCPVPHEERDVIALEFGNVEFCLDIAMGAALSAPVEATLDKGVLSILLPHQAGGQVPVTLL